MSSRDDGSSLVGVDITVCQPAYDNSMPGPQQGAVSSDGSSNTYL